jgi:deoxyribose-phosphate aldolase
MIYIKLVMLKGACVMSVEIAGLIDHTLLKADATKEQIKGLCEEAKKYQFASVCVNPTWVKYASELLQGSDVKVCTVIGFPLGANTSEVKAFETTNAIENGAQEVDMVINIGALKDKDDQLVESDIRAVIDAVAGKALTKVIIETSLLTEEEKIRACELSVKAGTDFVKTSTGFSTGGATVEDVALMRKTVGPDIGVKASGGVRNTADAEAIIRAGATRIGASAGVAIVNGLTADSDY